MSLTPAQYTTLKADMHSAGNAAALGGFLSAADWPSVAAWYNAPSGATVWRPNVPVGELNAVIVGSVFDGLTVQKQNGWFALTQGGIVDATSATMRAWFQDIFGTGATLTALTAAGQKPATRFQLLFATAAAPSNVSSVFGQVLTAQDVQDAERLG